MNASKIMHPNQINNYDEFYEIQIKFDRSNVTYKPDELVTGSLMIVSKTNTAFKLDIDSASLNIFGSVTIANRLNKPEYEEIIKRTPPIRIIVISDMIIGKNKTLTPDAKLPFRFKLQKGEHRYLQSYIGVYINISYTINAFIRFTQKRTMQSETPFYVQVPKAGREVIDNFVYPKKKNFMLVTEDIKGDKNKIPNFKIRVQLQSEICFFNDDLNGIVIVDQADTPIRSIDLQMMRVERIQVESKVINEKTQIQLIQICDGNVTRNLQIPLYMILPRYYSCPSVKYLWCNVNFQFNLQIIFKDGYKVLVNIPLKLIRS